MKIALKHNGCLVLFFLWQLLCPATISGQVKEALIRTGLEDVAVVDETDALYIAYSDKVHRSAAHGLFEVLRLLTDDLKTDKDVYLVFREEGISQFSVILAKESILAYRNEQISLSRLMSFVQISYETDAYDFLFKEIRPENRSAGKVDLVFYPQISLNSSWLDKHYGMIVNIAPAIEIELWRGASFTGQAIFPVWNNLKGEMDYIRAGMLLFRQNYRFPKNIFMTFNIGNFNENRMGADLSFRYISCNDRWEAGFNAGITGSSTFYSGQWEISEWRRGSGSVSFRYYEPYYNLQFDLAAHRFVFGDYGLRLDCTRHVGEIAIGFYGMYSGGEANGGFHFAIPLPGKKRTQRRAIRLTYPAYYDMEYEARSGNEYFRKRLGRLYETRPDQNRSQRYYHPSYLKKMLSGYASGIEKQL